MSTRVGYHALLQGIFLTQGSNSHLLYLHWQAGSLPLEPPGKPQNRGTVIQNRLVDTEGEEGGRIERGAYACMRVLSRFSRVQLFATPWSVDDQTPLSMGFSRQEYWSGLPCPPPGDLPDPGIEPASLMSPASAGGFFTTSTTGGNPPVLLPLSSYTGFRSSVPETEAETNRDIFCYLTTDLTGSLLQG